MIDFEQLKIGNVDLGEKVEERNEDIRKLTGKVRATVQVLTHVKEKLHFLQVHTHIHYLHGDVILQSQAENEKKKELLAQLDFDLAKVGSSYLNQPLSLTHFNCSPPETRYSHSTEADEGLTEAGQPATEAEGRTGLSH